MDEALSDAADADDRRVGLIEEGGVFCQEGRIEWVGRWADRPRNLGDVARLDAAVALPALVECHTHALFAGSRHREFGLRNAGRTYAEILEAGGGILSTVEATRAASDEALAASLSARLEAFRQLGCGVVEVKTGYGLEHEQELRHLRIIREVANNAPVEVVATYLGAHAIPPEHRRNRDAYVDEICGRTLPAAAEAGLADAADVFCDRGAFTAEEAARILGRARELGLARRIHTDELSASGGCAVAAAVRAQSADHLEYASAGDIEHLARADVACVLLPGVTVFLDTERRPDARAMVAQGLRVALSTDYNPGSSHTLDLWLMVTLACTLLKLTPGEALRGVTRVPAEVLERGDRFGRIGVGRRGWLLTADLPSWHALPYHMSAQSHIHRVGF
jgi:imidazolonepropionase